MAVTLGGSKPWHPTPLSHPTQNLNPKTPVPSIGAYTITYTILGAPFYNYSIMGPETLFQV